MVDVQLYLGDCLEILPTLLDASVDAVITDPPFGTGMYDWDKPVSSKVWQALKYLCPDGPIAIFGYAKQLFSIAKHFEGLSLIGYIVWHKYNQVIVSPGLTRVHQDVAIWGKSLKQIKAGEVREPYSKLRQLEKWHNGRDGVTNTDLGLRLRAQAKRNGDIGKRNPDGRRCTDLWRIPAPGAGFNSHLRNHPNEKPLEVMLKLTRLLSIGAEIVLDPFMGSGTTGVACVQTGRSFFGIEICKEYYEIARRRIEEAQAKAAEPQQAELSMSYG